VTCACNTSPTRMRFASALLSPLRARIDETKHCGADATTVWASAIRHLGAAVRIVACGCGCCAPVPCAVQALRGVLAARGPGSLGFVGSSSGEIMRSMAPCGTCIRVQDRSTTNSTLYAESERLGAFCDATTESWTPDGPADRDDSGAFRIQVSKNAKNAGSH